MSDDLFKRAYEYCERARTQLIVQPILGTGIDGMVWQSKRRTAVKAFERLDNFENEVECYRRFAMGNVTKIGECAVPHLEGTDSGLMVIEMTIVTPPYVLDFAKVYFDSPPPYDSHLIENALAESRELFGADFPRMLAILSKLKSFGIHYVDPKPANIRFNTGNELD